MRKIDEIIVHCTATRPDWMAGQSAQAKRDEVRRWHVRDRGWSDIGYHVIIDRDGTVVDGRPFERVGAHVQGHNTGTLGVSLVGGHGSSENDDIADNFTPMQEAALGRWIDGQMKRFPAIGKVSGHNQYAAKACPGFRADRWWAERIALKAKVAAAEKAHVQSAPVVPRISGLNPPSGVSGVPARSAPVADATIDAIVERVLLRLMERGATLDASVTIDLKEGT